MTESTLDSSTLDQSGQASPAAGASPPPLSRGQRILRRTGWTLLGLFALIVFTLAKLPEARLKNFVLGHLQNALASRGVIASATKAHLSLGLGVTYVLEGVVLTPPAPDLPIKIDEVDLSPSLLPLLLGRAGGTVVIQQADTELTASFSSKGPDARIRFKADKVNLGRMGLLNLFVGIRGSGIVTGQGSIQGNLSVPSTWNGEGRLNLTKISLEQQNIQGFNIPGLSISEGTVDLHFEGGKGQIRKLTFGKPGYPNDDLVASVTGDLQLNNSLETTQLSAKARFRLSDRILKSKELTLLEMILSQGKTPDGDYAYALSGSVMAPMAVPAAGAP